MTVPPLSPPRPGPAPSSEPAASPWPSLERLLQHVLALIEVDAAAFLLVDERRRWVRPAASWFASPLLREALAPSARWPFDPARPGLLELVLERDRPLLLPKLEAWEAAHELERSALERLGDFRGREAWAALAQASLICTPLKSGSGSPLGALVLAATDPARPLRSLDLGIAEALSDVSGVALERAELLDRESRRAGAERRLKRAAEAVAGSLELDEVYRSVAEQGTEVARASRALLTRLDSRAHELRPVASVDFSEPFASRRLSVERSALSQVVRTRRPCLGGEEDWARAEGVGSFMHVPIELGPRLFGVLTVAHERPGRFGEADLEALVSFARSSAAAIANAIDFQRERRIARALTLGFVPESLPDVPGFETGLLYAPSSNEPTGGDVYGAWPLPGGELALLVGDVAGKGVETAALSAMVRFFVEARSWGEPSPAVVLRETNAMLMERLPGSTFVTAFLAVLSPGRVRWCNAGHLPPLVLAGGEPRQLPGGGLPLGVDGAAGYRELELDLEPSALLVAYTDGLVEARREGEMYGVERLAALVAERGRRLHPQELVGVLHDETSSWAGGLSDDAVALALRRRA
ncbi:MAG: SpoIIE family protein phosphatase [Thermoleophilaceae bacterium]